MLKVCTKCKEVKPLEGFYSHKAGKFGKRASCKVCYKRQIETWKLENKEKVKVYTLTWREANKDRYNQSHANWSSFNRDKRNAKEGYRRAYKLQATPNWLTESQLQEIKQIYALAKECEMLTGDKYHVDHILPLKGKDVCGLHVPWNLQVLPADVNLKKSNSCHT
jgi:hypothetical protein